jgi:hypothetical protein
VTDTLGLLVGLAVRQFVFVTDSVLLSLAQHALFPEWESVLELQASAVGQAEKREAVRLGDNL